MRTKARALLTSLAACSAALLCLLWLLFQREPLLERGHLSRDPGAPLAARVEDLSPGVPLQTELHTGRVPIVARTTRSAEAESPAIVAGHLTIDGTPPEGAQLTLRSEDGSWGCIAGLARDGSFSVDAVPITKLTLSFQLLQPSDPRPLLLPSVDLVPRPGEKEELDLDWKTRQINVRVIDDGQPGSNARVEVEGPHQRTSFWTNEKGIARLSLIGAGRFAFRAVVPGGRAGRTTVEIGEDDELTSVVIAVESR